MGDVKNAAMFGLKVAVAIVVIYQIPPLRDMVFKTYVGGTAA